MLLRSSALGCTRGCRQLVGLRRTLFNFKPQRVSLRSPRTEYRKHYHKQVNAMASSATFSYPPPIVHSPVEPTAVVIMLHGLGDTGHGWASIGGQFGAIMKHVKFIFPNAPTRPITLNMGFRMPGWYDIASLDGIDRKEDAAGIKESGRYIDELISKEIAAGVPADRIVVAGFSQGGAIALYALRSTHKLAGVVGLSTYVPLHEDKPIVSQANTATPVLLCHGDFDRVVAYEFGKKSYEELKEAGIKVNFKTYHGMGHEACPEELNDVQKFLMDLVPPNPKS